MNFKRRKKGSASGVAFILLLFILLGFAIYALYLTMPGEEIKLTFIDNLVEKKPKEPLNYAGSEQFYENMRFPKKEISYKIEDKCDAEKRANVVEAFSILESRTVLRFFPANKGDITVLCSEIAPNPENERYFVAGEGGPTAVINTSLYAVIFSGKVSFFRNERCDTPNVALHEILHSLGFDHNNNPDSIMFPTLDCDQTIDEEIIKDINRLYSIEPAADLEIDRVEATKSGRYLTFEIEVLNQGLEDALDADLKVYYDGKLVEFEGGREALGLGDIDVGTKKILSVTNAKISRSSKRIVFVVDEEDKIDEIFEDNNRVELVIDKP